MKKKTYIICYKCKAKKNIVIETSVEFDHLEANYCPKCENGEDYYEETFVDSEGRPVSIST